MSMLASSFSIRHLLQKGGICLLLVMGCLTAYAQHHAIYASNIASLQVLGNDDWQSMPIVELNGAPIHISFDEMSHDYHRYIYKIEHCEADWTVTEGLFGSDFLIGFNGNPPIENYQQSINTNCLYTHYSLTIPNEQCRIKMSGNYQLTVYDEDNENTPVLKACFMVVEPLVNVAGQVSSNTDIDVNKEHQQVSAKVDFNKLSVSNPSSQIKTVILQNGKWSSAVVLPRPDYVTAKEMQWLHARELIFPAGNVYHKFEMLDLNHTTMGLDEIKWDGEDFHAFLQTDMPRPSYVYDEAPHGAFYIRNSDNVENDIASDYAWVHFTLKAPRQLGDVFINADWTNDSFLPSMQMQYNDAAQCYETAVLLKQGYYSYRYVLVDEYGKMGTVSTEGNFYQTQNTYQILVYYRGNGERTDRLVGYGKIKSSNR